LTTEQVLYANLAAITLLALVYRATGWREIVGCYRMWFTRDYWTSYNIVEIISWMARAVIIVPGLIFGITIWWLYFITLATSLALIWASNRKMLPTLVGFNTLWTWISCMVLARYLG